MPRAPTPAELRPSVAALAGRWKKSVWRGVPRALEAAASSKKARLRALAGRALQECLAAPAGSLPPVEPAFPVLAALLRLGEQPGVELALAALQEMSRWEKDVFPAAEALATCLGHPLAASLLYLCASRGHALRALEPALERAWATALGEDQAWLRYHASRALTLSRTLRGAEPRLAPRGGALLEDEQADWAVEVSPRRLFAASDAPLAEGAEPHDARHRRSRPCAVCGGADTACIYRDTTSDLTGSSGRFEYRCAACGNYSLFEFTR